MNSSRRDFLRISGLTVGAVGLKIDVGAQSSKEIVAIIADPADIALVSAPLRWALHEVSQALEKRGIHAGQFASIEQAPSNSFCIVASSASREPAVSRLKTAGVTIAGKTEFSALLPLGKRHGVMACGDARGLMYALLELADRIQYSERPLDALVQQDILAEHPANAVRSIGRLFTSDVQDKSWFYDREMWPAYFAMLATQRFNRFSLNFGIGYDSLDNVRDSYLLFAYPFLLAVPGYNVRAVTLPDEERDRNLEVLRFISAQAVAHGIDFQLGIWTHGYRWGAASEPNYTIEGLTPENHAAYSREALAALLKACPDISGVTLRTHGESGVREGSYAFWSTVFSGVPASGRKVRLDLHTKGLDQKLVDAALQTGMPITLSPKYWAEHMGLPYHQTAIRELEMPHEDRKTDAYFALSNGSRSFTRYGYADFLREDRAYQVMFRIWPGSHRLLLWGDPQSARAYARAFGFCGCDGVELFEPLSFKGRRGSGIAGSRCAYADTSLVPHWDWEKYLYTYRTWGRLMYSPETKPDVWQRYLRKQFRAAAADVEAALGSASAITPIITTAHLPSAANDAYNPEYYVNQSIVDDTKPSPYAFDTPAPKVFGNVSPLDPQLFSTINEFVAGLLNRERSAKYSPLEVAEWLEAAAAEAESHLGRAEGRIRDKRDPEFRRAAIDLRIEIGIARFFAAKFRSGVLYAGYQKSGDRATLKEAVKQYRRAREIWHAFAENAKGIYVSDITFGPAPYQRGNWLDRIAAMDADIAEMQQRLESNPSPESPRTSLSLHDLTVAQKRPSLDIHHAPPGIFVSGQPLEIVLGIPASSPQSLAVRIYYRHVNQAERYKSAEMHREGSQFHAIIPAAYTDSAYPLQYYFELRSANGAWLFPGLGSKLQGQPYFVVRRATPLVRG